MRFDFAEVGANFWVGVDVRASLVPWTDGSTAGAFVSLGEALLAVGGVEAFVIAVAAISAAGFARLFGSCCLSTSVDGAEFCLFAPGPIGAGLAGC